ncbi:MAG: hypothetical protein HEEMFOPI_02008 [Holosporales bacterium]
MRLVFEYFVQKEIWYYVLKSVVFIMCCPWQVLKCVLQHHCQQVEQKVLIDGTTEDDLILVSFLRVEERVGVKNFYDS